MWNHKESQGEAGRKEREQQNGLLNTVLRLVLEKGLCRLDRQGQHLFPCENPRWNALASSLCVLPETAGSPVSELA
jgi:hypothetical protein